MEATKEMIMLVIKSRFHKIIMEASFGETTAFPDKSVTRRISSDVKDIEKLIEAYEELENKK